jgi:hypothetical protein
MAHISIEGNFALLCLIYLARFQIWGPLAHVYNAREVRRKQSGPFVGACVITVILVISAEYYYEISPLLRPRLAIIVSGAVIILAVMGWQTFRRSIFIYCHKIPPMAIHSAIASSNIGVLQFKQCAFLEHAKSRDGIEIIIYTQLRGYFVEGRANDSATAQAAIDAIAQKVREFIAKDAQQEISG